MKLAFNVLPERYVIAQLSPDAAVPQWALNGAMFSVTRTPSELSVICEERVCAADKAEHGWRCIEVVGPFPLTAVGVAAEFSRVFAERKISLLVVSTYDTDYIFLSEQTLDPAIEALIDAGHDVIR